MHHTIYAYKFIPTWSDMRQLDNENFCVYDVGTVQVSECNACVMHALFILFLIKKESP